VATLTYDSPSGGYWLDNGTIKFLVQPSSVITNLTIQSLPRDVAYFYMYFGYLTETALTGNFYLNAIGNFTLAISSTPLTTVSITLTNAYTDTNGITHNFTITVSLTDGDGYGKFDFQVIADVGLKKLDFNIESNIYPQGYGSQSSGANYNVGGNVSYTVPALYNDKTYSFWAEGLIQEDTTTLENANTLIDNYLVCYGTDASVGFFTNYVDLERARAYCKSTGTERQFAWLDLVTRPLTKYTHTQTFYFGAWADGSAVSIQSAYNALPYVETVNTTPGSPMYTRMVRPYLNTLLYDYNEKLNEHTDLMAAHSFSSPGNAFIVPAGHPDYLFYKHRGKSSKWNGTVADIKEDFIQKTISMAGEAGMRVYIEIDVIDETWITNNPLEAAVYKDESTQSTQWVKIPELITPGKGFHDAFIDRATYLCENYNFYGLVITECFFRDYDYSTDAKTQFLTDNPTYTDWPRDGGGAVDIYDETLGKWKTQKLGQLWNELKTIANASGKKFFVMVEPNFENEARQAWEYGQYYPDAIQNCDGLWVWGYFKEFGVPYQDLYKIYNKTKPLQTQYSSKEFIISVGLYPTGNQVTAAELDQALSYLNSYWPYQNTQGVEVIPGNYMTAAHWDVLWQGTLRAILSADETGELFHFMEFQFSGGTIRYTTGPHDMTWNGQTWTGIGGALGFEPVEEGADLRAQGMAVVMSGVNQAIINVLLSQNYLGREAMVWMAHLDSSKKIICDPSKDLIFSGRMNDGFDVEEVPGDHSKPGSVIIRARLVSRLSDLGARNGIQTTLGVHQAFFPGDMFFEFIPDMLGKRFSWGGSGGGGNIQIVDTGQGQGRTSHGQTAVL